MNKVHDAGNLGALSGQNSNCCLVIAMKANSPIGPHVAPEHAGEVDKVKLLPGDARTYGRVKVVTWKP